MLKNNVPPFVAQMKEMAELFHVEQMELDQLEIKIEKLIKQFYIKSATYTIEDWEKEFALLDGIGMSIEQRRARLLAKLNTRTPATVEMIANLVKQTMGVEHVVIEEFPENYMFVIRVKEDSLSDLLGVTKEAVHYARPAHLDYHFIEQLVRNSLIQLYAGAWGSGIRQSSATVAIDRLYSGVYLAGLGTFIAIRKGSVT